MNLLPQTPSQTVGPFFAYGLTARQYGYAYTDVLTNALLGPDAPGTRIVITGRVLDGQGNPVPDAIIELWQADTAGHYRTEPINPPGSNSTDFVGMGRVGTGTQAGAVFRFETVKPGSTEPTLAGPSAAPHIHVVLLMRGSLRALHTRLYFSDETEANATDPLLNMVPAERRNTLIANRIELASGVGYQFDVQLQGEQETVFFDL
jgi:protocatechuate 3,4-dioxygenase, alpha subunit